MTPARKPRLVKAGEASPLAALEALPGWWRGKAVARMQFAEQAEMRGDDTERDIHLRTAAEYERRVRSIVKEMT